VFASCFYVLNLYFTNEDIFFITSVSLCSLRVFTSYLKFGYTYVCMYVRTYVMCVRACVRLYIHTYVCMYIRMYVCACERAFVYKPETRNSKPQHSTRCACAWRRTTSCDMHCRNTQKARVASKTTPLSPKPTATSRYTTKTLPPEPET
jgi:hypothetical protein